MSHYFENDQNLTNKPNEIIYNYQSCSLKFKTNSGVFSKKQIDFGSRLLVETFIQTKPKGSLLDLGSGYGFIGLTLAKLTNVNSTLIDINEQAIILATENAKLNKLKVETLVSDGFSNIKQKYNYIITNPPIRIGKQAMYKLLAEAKDHLLEDGQLWLVIRKAQGAKTLLKDLENIYKFEVIIKKSGFYIIKGQIA